MSVVNMSIMQPLTSQPLMAQPTVGGPGRPYSAAPMQLPLPLLVQQLGTQTRIDANGMVRFNEPLVRQIAGSREMAVPPLYQFLQTASTLPAILEGLYVADRLAETRVANVQQLYGATSRLNSHLDPLVQIYLAGFYRKLQQPATFGPLLSTLVNRALLQYPLQSSPTHNVMEEVGGAVLQQIAEHTANETVKRLLQYLQPNQQPLPISQSQFSKRA